MWMLACVQFKAKLSEMVHLQRMQEERPPELLDQKMTDAQFLEVSDFLSKQREGLKHLTEILKKDMRDIEILNTRLASEAEAASQQRRPPVW